MSGRSVVADMPHQSHANAHFLPLGDRHLRRLQHGHVTEEAVAIYDDGGGRFVDHADVWPRVQVTLLQLAAIPWGPADSVAADTPEFGVHQQAADRGSVLFAGPGIDETRLEKCQLAFLLNQDEFVGGKIHATPSAS